MSTNTRQPAQSGSLHPIVGPSLREAEDAYKQWANGMRHRQACKDACKLCGTTGRMWVNPLMHILGTTKCVRCDGSGFVSDRPNASDHPTAS